jgi:phosphate acetyltransferase
MTVIDRLRELSRQHPKRIVFPETADPRVISAARLIAERQLGTPILITSQPEGNPDDLPTGIEVVPLNDRKLAAACARQLYENRKHRGLSLDAAELAVSDPLLFAALLVKIGIADAGVAGSLATTANVIRAGLYGIGTEPGKGLVSSFFLMQFPDKCWTYADCGVVPQPNAEELAEIAIDAARNHQRLLGEPPRIAMLSFSTKGSADHPDVLKVRQATELVQNAHPDWLVDGELQFDAAFSPEVAALKAPGSPLAGQANVFVFPDLDAGNIGYKLTERLGNARAIGPLIQGLSRPFMDLSRGCQVDDIVNVAVIAGMLSQATADDATG